MCVIWKMQQAWWNGRHERLKIAFQMEYGFKSRRLHHISIDMMGANERNDIT